VRISRQHDFQDPLVWALNVSTKLAVLSGDRSEQARQYGVEAVEIAEKSGSAFQMVFALRALAVGQLLSDAWEDALGAIEQALEIARVSRVGLDREIDLVILHSEAKLAGNDGSGARSIAEQAISQAVERGARHHEALAELALARALRAEGSVEAAREALARVTTGISETGGRATEPAVVEEAARLDQLEGNEPALALVRARDLYSSIGARGHADRVARELAELS